MDSAIYNAIENRYPNEGSWSFAIALCITIAGALGFYYLYLNMQRKNAPEGAL
tara:strand:- start:18312 stop:18470 length:159 start_codon:yes stop_codon:yes gene_type:complete